MSYFLPPQVAEAPDPPSEQQPARPSQSGSFKSVDKKEYKLRIPRSSSLGHWWRNMIPSQKPERGGTARVSYPTDFDNDSGNKIRVKPHRRATDGRRSRRSETHDSDIFTGWNIAKDLSESNDAVVPGVGGRRAVSHATGASLQDQHQEPSDRKWSWVPHVQLPEHLSVNPRVQNPRDRKVSWQETALEEDSEPHTSADYLADRRLSNARRAIEAKKEARRQRRSLKESGDYLGVQGINPETGQLDVITPSNSDSSTDASDFNQKVEAVKKVLKDSRTHHKNALLPGQGEREAKRLYLKREKEKRAREEHRKQELAARQNQGLHWKRQSKQWSSAQEPALSTIAQSVRSGMSSSRRPSLPFNEMSQEGQLIDFSSPRMPAGNEKELPPPPVHDASGSTSKAGTVVHTRRPSVADDSFSSADLELFENGISFDRDLQLPTGQTEGKAPFPSSKLSTADHARRTHSGSEFDCAPNSGLADDCSTNTAHEFEVPKGDSFLGLPALGAPVAQGRISGLIPRPLSTTNLLSGRKTSAPRRSISLFPKKHQSSIGLSQSSPQSESPHSGSTLSPATLAKLRTPRRMGEPGEEEAHTLLGASPLHRLSPTHLLQRVKKKRMQRAGALPVRNELEQHTTVLEPLTNSNQAHQAPGPRETHGSTCVGDDEVSYRPVEGCEIPKATPAHIQVDMDYLKKEVAKVDTLNWMKERKALDPLQTDVQWIEGTIKDITEKGDKVIKEPASTPTITTTGSAPPTSGSSQSAERLENKTTKKPHLAPTHGFRKPHPAGNSLASMISPQNRRQSSLLSLTPEGQIVPVDITSIEARGWNHPQKENEHTHSLSIFTSAKVAEKEIIRGTGDYTVANPGPNYPSQQAKEAQVQVPVDLLPMVNPRVPEKGSKDLPHLQAKATQDFEQFLQHLIQTIPGAYPFHPADEDDTDDLFEELRMSRTILRLRSLGEHEGNLWDAVKEFAFVVRCHVEVTFRLYWGIAGPVFNSGSQYWVRNKSGNATLLDGVAFILAVPGAFLGLLVFV